MSDTDAVAVAALFAIPGQPVSAVRHGSGHVNTTYLVTTNNGQRFVLQRINERAFSDPQQVMENIVTVTQHLAAKTAGRTLRLVPARDGGWWVTWDGVWRLYEFVEGSTEMVGPPTPDGLRRVGQAYGEFLLALDDLPIECLHTTIDGFHDEPRYMARLRTVIAADPVGRAHLVGPEIAAALSYETLSHALDEPHLMPLRATHNDAKVANVLFDEITGQPLCVIDLDTVQPGLAVNDFGDAIRSGATTAAEDDPGPVAFSRGLFEAFTQGYLGACGQVLAPSEIAQLRHGAALMTLETSLRFLTDFIEGDVYYATQRPDQNLDRARNQLALLNDICANWAWMGEVIDATVASSFGRCEDK